MNELSEKMRALAAQENRDSEERYLLNMGAGFIQGQATLIEQLRRENRRIHQTLHKLEKEKEFLDCLRAVGVDNWDGYKHACELYWVNDENAD